MFPLTSAMRNKAYYAKLFRVTRIPCALWFNQEPQPARGPMFSRLIQHRRKVQLCGTPDNPRVKEHPSGKVLASRLDTRSPDEYKDSSRLPLPKSRFQLS